jgi:hypothetical protein
VEKTLPKPASVKTPSKLDDRSVIILLILVMTAIILLGWYAFFSGPTEPGSTKTAGNAARPATQKRGMIHPIVSSEKKPAAETTGTASKINPPTKP